MAKKSTLAKKALNKEEALPIPKWEKGWKIKSNSKNEEVLVVDGFEIKTNSLLFSILAKWQCSQMAFEYHMKYLTVKTQKAENYNFFMYNKWMKHSQQWDFETFKRKGGMIK